MSSTVADPLIGAVLDGRYRVLEHLADGGMATVYLAVDTRLDREVALKVMRSDLALDEAFVARFHREARSAARLSHPHVVGVYDQGEDRGLMFLAMEYVPGQTLREVLDHEGALSPRAATDLLLPVLQALGAAHKAGLIHRDVKPENVILREDGVVKVADFGLARAVTTTTSTTCGVLLGTAAYLSPEQVERGIADARSDVYAAGLLLFEMLTGSKAVVGDHPVHVAYQHVHTGVPAPSTRAPGIPAVLDELVLAATAKDPDARPADATALAAMLRAARRELTPAELDARPQGPGAASAAAQPTRATRAPQPPQPARPARPVRLGEASATAHVSTTVPAGATARIPIARRAAPAPPTRRRRRVWPWVLVLLAAAVLGTTAWLFMTGPLAATTVPRVSGLQLAAAQTALQGQHLSGTQVDTFSETVDKGVVITTDPPAGSSVRRGLTVALSVSRGPERHAVPEVVGRGQQEAVSLLTDASLTPKVTQAYDDKVPSGTVVSANPKPGTSLKRDAQVTLVVSKGRQPIAVADWTGKPAADATKALTKAGLTVDATQQQFSDTVTKDSVISQNPPTGTLYKGERVTLVVSKGPQLVTIPDGLVGKQVEEVRGILEGLRLKVVVENVFGGKFRTVTQVQPGGGDQVAPGSTVTLVVV